MAGGLMQLVAYGAQDVYLTGNPKVTFFQAVYKRHTNFAMENIEQTVNGTPGADGCVSVTIARNGDLVADMYVEMKAGTVAATDDAWIAERAVKDVELSIGGQRIDKHYQKWWRLYSELYLDESKKANYGKMTTSAVNLGKIFLPLIFFFNRNPGLALPLIALQYHESDWISICPPPSRPSPTAPLSRSGQITCISIRRNDADLRKRVTNTSSSKSSTPVPTPSPPVRKSKSVSPTTTQSRNLSGAWTTVLTPGAPRTPTRMSPLTSSASPPSRTASSPPPSLVPHSSPSRVPTSPKKTTVPSIPSSWSSTAKIASRSNPANTSTPCYHSCTSPALRRQVSTRTPSRSSQKNISRPVTSLVLTMLKSLSRRRLHRGNHFRMFATNYNVLRIQSGMGGLALSNVYLA